MAFLLPENIPSRSGVPERLRQTARALRDCAPDEVTVWLRETMGGLPYLVVLDPAAGIMVVDAPSLSATSRRRRHQGRVFDSFDAVSIPSDELAATAAELHRVVDASAIEDLPVACVLAFPDLDEIPLERLGEADRTLPILTRADLSHRQLEGALHRVVGGERVHPLRDQEEKRARAVVNPEIVLPQPSTTSLPLFQDPEIPPEDVIRVMDREQERVAEHLGAGYRVLRGVAGSGKTLVLAHRARLPAQALAAVADPGAVLQPGTGQRPRHAMVDPRRSAGDVTNIDRLAATNWLEWDGREGHTGLRCARCAEALRR